MNNILELIKLNLCINLFETCWLRQLQRITVNTNSEVNVKVKQFMILQETCGLQSDSGFPVRLMSELNDDGCA